MNDSKPPNPSLSPERNNAMILLAPQMNVFRLRAGTAPTSVLLHQMITT